MYFFNIKLLIICTIHKIRTMLIWIHETKEMCC